MTKCLIHFGLVVAVCVLSTSCSKGLPTPITVPQASEAGNGGNGVVCRDEQGKIVSVRLLDFYEAKVLRDTDYSLGTSKLSVADKVNLVIERLRRVDPQRAKKYQERADAFTANMAFKSKLELSPLKDYGYVQIPLACNIEQVCIQKTPKTSDEKLYSINLDLWDWLDSDHRAGLRLHEIVYGDALEHGHKDSVRARGFTGLISSAAIEQLSQLDYNEAVRKFGLDDARTLAPFWLKIPTFTACAGTYFTADASLYASPAPAGTTNFFSSASVPSWSQLYPNGVLVGKPQDSDIGKKRFDIFVSGPGGASEYVKSEAWMNVIQCSGSPGSSKMGLGKAIALSSRSKVTCGIFEESVGSANRVVRCWDNKGAVALPWSIMNPKQVSVGWAGEICVLDEIGVHCTNDFLAKTFSALDTPRYVDAGGCAIDKRGLQAAQLFVVGSNVVPSLSDATAVSMGGKFACAINATDMACWGDYGANLPKKVTHPRKVQIMVQSGCVQSDEGVQCWDQGFGDMPGGTGVVSKDARDFCLSDNVFCELKEDGSVKCSGVGMHAPKSGTGISGPPPVFKNPSQISCGEYFACVIDEGVPHCWGTVTDKEIPNT